MVLFNRGFLFTVAVVTAAMLVGDAAAAATYVVGDASGWMVPSGGPATYTTWASQYVFRVGDVLVFNFGTGLHDVARVTKEAFDSCSSTNAIALATVGPASFTLNSTGPDYYICTFGQHCSLGQKLTINVTSATPTPSPAPPPLVLAPTPTATPTTPSPSTSPTSPSTSPESSPSTSPQSSPSTSPSPSLSTSPESSPSPSLSTSPESSPSPTPSGTTTPPPSGPSPPPSIGDMSPPPPPANSAEIVTIRTPFFMLASVAAALCFVM